MITERIMASGDWSLTMKGSAPESVMQWLLPERSAFSTLFVTPSRLISAALTDALIQSFAVYNGILVAKQGRTISGYHASAWLGMPGDTGPKPRGPVDTFTPGSYQQSWVMGYGGGQAFFPPATAGPADNLRNFVRDILTGGDLLLGNVEAGYPESLTGQIYWWAGNPEPTFGPLPGGGNFAQWRGKQNPYFHCLRALNAVCRWVAAKAGTPVEWRVRNDRRLDVGNPLWMHILYKGFDLVTVVDDPTRRSRHVRNGAGEQVSASFAAKVDYSDWRSSADAWADVLLGAWPGATASKTTTLRHWSGAGLHQEAGINTNLDNKADRTDLLFWARQLLNEGRERREFSLSMDSHIIPWETPVGFFAQVFSPANGIVDFSASGITSTSLLNGVDWVKPVTMRVMDATWPVVAGCGVYLVRTAADGGPRVIDLSDHFEPERGETRVTVSELPNQAATLNDLALHPAYTAAVN